MNADVIILGPGGLYTSLIPNLLVEGISKALRDTQAKKIYVANLINKRGQTPLFKVSDYLREIQHYIGKDVFDFLIVNEGKPPKELIKAYAQEGDLVQNDITGRRVVSVDLLGSGLKEVQKGDTLQRNLIRHDPQKLAQELMRIVAAL